MGRLTYEIIDSGWCVDYNEIKSCEIEDGVFVYFGNAIQKLKEYEDLDDNKALIKLPCKEIYSKCGDTVFLIYDGEIIDVLMCNPIILEDGSIQITLCSDEFIFECRTPDSEHDTDPQDWCDNHIEVTPDDFGKKVFFTREEAEKKINQIYR